MLKEADQEDNLRKMVRVLILNNDISKYHGTNHPLLHEITYSGGLFG